MGISSVLLLLALLGLTAGKQGIGPGEQDWGYIDVRPGAHMFYWLYRTTAPVADPSSRPLVIWLQGGPGASSTGYGNFEELGIVDLDLKEREHSWVKHVNVLFIDNPVGTGFSYVDSSNLLTTNNAQIARDLVNFTKQFYDIHPEFTSTGLYIFSESYGGKMAVEFALQLNEEVQAGRLNIPFHGAALGDSWISPIDSVLSWAPFLLQTGMVDTERYEAIDKYAQRTKQALDDGQFSDATNLWGQTEGVILDVTNNIDFYNILYKTKARRSSREETPRDFLFRLLVTRDDASLDALMNGHVKKTLGIPAGVTWGGQSGRVFNALYEDFMKPVTDVVEEVLNTTRLKLVVFTGQLDLIVDTPGTLKWADNLQWYGSNQWKENRRAPLVVNGFIEGYYKGYENFHFYWINRAGHMVPTDNPEAGLEMLRLITNFE